LAVLKESGAFLICGLMIFLILRIWRALVNQFFKNQYDAIYRFKMILDNSEESIIIISDRKINYVNKKFVNRYKSVIMKFEDIEDIEGDIPDKDE
jgi:hypothetical protein